MRTSLGSHGQANVAEFAMYRVTNGRIVEFTGTSDSVELLAQLTGAPSIENRR